MPLDSFPGPSTRYQFPTTHTDSLKSARRFAKVQHFFTPLPFLPVTVTIIEYGVGTQHSDSHKMGKYFPSKFEKYFPDHGDNNWVRRHCAAYLGRQDKIFIYDRFII